MTTQATASGRFLGLLVMLLGLFPLFAGAYYGYESWLLVQDGRETSGTVVDFHEQLSEDQQVRYAPVLEYEVNGRPYRFVSADYANSPKFNIGERLIVLYDPEQPDQARLKRFGALWGLPLGLGLAGLLVFGAGLGITVRNARKTG